VIPAALPDDHDVRPKGRQEKDRPREDLVTRPAATGGKEAHGGRARSAKAWDSSSPAAHPGLLLAHARFTSAQSACIFKGVVPPARGFHIRCGPRQLKSDSAWKRGLQIQVRPPPMGRCSFFPFGPIPRSRIDGCCRLARGLVAQGIAIGLQQTPPTRHKLFHRSIPGPGRWQVGQKSRPRADPPRMARLISRVSSKRAQHGPICPIVSGRKKAGFPALGASSCTQAPPAFYRPAQRPARAAAQNRSQGGNMDVSGSRQVGPVMRRHPSKRLRETLGTLHRFAVQVE